MKQRLPWDQLPPDVRAGVEGILGEKVVAATSQPGGFSPGSADRVQLASGRRAFVKAVSAQTNDAAAELHRKEAVISSALPSGVPAPKLLGMYDDGTWVALVLSDVAGQHPQEPWRDTELQQVLDSLAAMARLAPPELPPGHELQRHEESLRAEFLGWEKLLRRPLEPGADVPALEPWVVSQAEEFADLARTGLPALAGNQLVHGDLRADNILLTQQGAVLLDWPWADLGASWSDALAILINVKTTAPQADVEKWIQGHPAFACAASGAINGVLAGWAGYFIDASRRPGPPGIPTLRAFQRKQGDAVVSWLRDRR